MLPATRNSGTGDGIGTQLLLSGDKTFENCLLWDGKESVSLVKSCFSISVFGNVVATNMEDNIFNEWVVSQDAGNFFHDLLYFGAGKTESHCRLFLDVSHY